MTSKQSFKVNINSQGKTRIVYIDRVPNYTDFIKVLKNYFINDNTLFIYWIDNKYNKQEINGNESYQGFLKVFKRKKLYIDFIEIDDSKAGATALKQHPPIVNNQIRAHHVNKYESCDSVMCDECKIKPIIGVHYKCVVCRNYKLCLSCKRKDFHREHKMIQISYVDEISNNLSNLDLSNDKDVNFTNSYSNHKHLPPKRNILKENPIDIFNKFSFIFSQISDHLGGKVDLTDECNINDNLMLHLKKNSLKSDWGPNSASSRNYPTINPYAIAEIVSSFDQMSIRIFEDIGLDKRIIFHINNDFKQNKELSKNVLRINELHPDLLMDILVNFNEMFVKVYRTIDNIVAKKFKTMNFPTYESTRGKENPDFYGDDKPDIKLSLTDLAETGLFNLSSTSLTKTELLNISSTSLSLESSGSNQSICSSGDVACSTNSEEYSEEKNNAKKIRSSLRKAKIQSSLQTLEGMGFDNTGDWLKDLLETLDGDINRAKHFLKPFK